MRKRLSILSWPKPKGGPHHAICHFCDTLHKADPIPEGSRVNCVCCGATLYQNRPNSLMRATSFSITALLLMIIVHTAPFIKMEAGSIQTALTLPGAAESLFQEGSPLVGISVAIFTIFTPLVVAGGLLYICAPLLFGSYAPGARFVAQWMSRTEQWNMIEVFLLGVLVSLLKLGALAELQFGLGFWAFTALMFCMAAAVISIDKKELWDRLEVASGK